MTAPNEMAIRRALETAGVEFIDEDGGGPGVRLRKVIAKDPTLERPSNPGSVHVRELVQDGGNVSSDVSSALIAQPIIPLIMSSGAGKRLSQQVVFDPVMRRALDDRSADRQISRRG